MDRTERTDQVLREETEQKELEELNRQGLAYIRSHLKKTRFEHTMRVREEAIRLAIRFNADPAKAETAAIFHDMAKNLSTEEMNALVRLYELGDRYIDHPDLAHSKIAAEQMRREFHITDPQLLLAVASHTTGRKGMGLLEKVVFLADAIEPGRNYPSVNEIRILAQRDLDLACIQLLERTIAYLQERKVPIDPDTCEALEYLRKSNHRADDA